MARKFSTIDIEKLERKHKVAKLVRVLSSSREDVRMESAAALGRLRDPAAVVPLIKILTSDTASVRVVAARALGRIRDPRAVPALFRMLQHKDPRIRWHVAQALESFDDRVSFESIWLAMKDRPARYPMPDFTRDFSGISN